MKMAWNVIEVQKSYSIWLTFKLIIFVLDPSLEKKKDLKSAEKLINESSNQFFCFLRHSRWIHQVIFSGKWSQFEKMVCTRLHPPKIGRCGIIANTH